MPEVIDPMKKPVPSSGDKHAQRLRDRDRERARVQAAGTDGRSAAEQHVERALAGARADEALREQARVSEARARGQWVPDEDDVVEEPAAVDPFDSPERRSAMAAWRNAAR